MVEIRNDYLVTKINYYFRMFSVFSLWALDETIFPHLSFGLSFQIIFNPLIFLMLYSMKIFNWNLRCSTYFSDNLCAFRVDNIPLSYFDIHWKNIFNLYQRQTPLLSDVVNFGHLGRLNFPTSRKMSLAKQKIDIDYATIEVLTQPNSIKGSIDENCW